MLRSNDRIPRTPRRALARLWCPWPPVLVLVAAAKSAAFTDNKSPTKAAPHAAENTVDCLLGAWAERGLVTRERDEVLEDHLGSRSPGGHSAPPLARRSPLLVGNVLLVALAGHGPRLSVSEGPL